MYNSILLKNACKVCYQILSIRIIWTQASRAKVQNIIDKVLEYEPWFRFFFLEGKAAKEIHERMLSTLSESYPSLRNHSILSEWIQQRQNEHWTCTVFRTTVQTTVTQENIDKVLDMILNDRRLKLDKHWIQCVELRGNYVEK